MYYYMRIGIVLDRYSGHLFHDVELLMVAFAWAFAAGAAGPPCTVDFIAGYGHNARDPGAAAQTLVSKLFGCDGSRVAASGEATAYDVWVERSRLDRCSINKAFAVVVRRFPNVAWSERFGTRPTAPGARSRILYVGRQNTGRLLSERSHQWLHDLVTRYDGTYVADMGELSLEDQMKVFRAHDVVIGVHGNNLVGVMWMMPGAHVFEILPLGIKKLVYDYHCLALSMRHQYTQIDCVGTVPETGSLGGSFSLTRSSEAGLEAHLHMLRAL